MPGCASISATVPTRHPYGLSLIQRHSERILGDWADELGVAMLRGVGITGFVENAGAIDVALSDGRTLRTEYLVGCDGGRSSVRKIAGIGFPGTDPTISHLLAEAELTGDPPWGLRSDEIGTHALSQVAGGKVGIMVTEQGVGTAEPTLALLRAALVAHYGTDFGVRNPTYITRFTDATRQAEHYRKDRVLLAGDAAHIHYPAGGFGMNLGIGDAVNLGWKLAAVVNGTVPDVLLDTYGAERHPVAAGLIRYTRASVALGRQDPHGEALSAVVRELVDLPEARRITAGRMSGLDTRYDFGPGHPLLGRRMPDLDLVTASGPTRVSALLHRARAVLLILGAPGHIAAGAWSGMVNTVAASMTGVFELPVIGPVPVPTAVLIRPDGHVGWVGEGSNSGLEAALRTWFGPR